MAGRRGACTAMQCALCRVSFIGTGLQNHYYLQWAPSGDVTSSIPDWFSPLVIPLRFLLLMSYMIPISLKVGQ